MKTFGNAVHECPFEIKKLQSLKNSQGSELYFEPKVPALQNLDTQHSCFLLVAHWVILNIYVLHE